MTDIVIVVLGVVVAAACFVVTLLLYKNSRLELANRYMTSSLEAAAAFQRSLMQEQPPEIAGSEISWLYEPCDELAGDAFGAYKLNGQQVIVYQLDVTGHGVKAALLAVNLLRLLNPNNPDNIVLDSKTKLPNPPAKVVGELNRRFQITPESNQFFTMIYGLFNPQSRSLVYVNAAHSSPVILSSNTRMLNGDSDLPVGVVDQTDFTEREIILDEKQSLVIYSDGITEAMREIDGELYGEDLFVTFLNKLESDSSAKRIMRELRTEIRRWCGKAGFNDDLSALILKCN